MADNSTMSPTSHHAPLRLAVVGHTNTGKTSLLRTLTRNPHFGEISNQPGTTRHVEGARLLIDAHTAIELYDTPGMEDSMALLEYIDTQLLKKDERLDGPDQILKFLGSPESTGRFEQEARVLRALLECHAALYVIDSRDPVLAKHKDELNLLARCGHPIMPVLNFTDTPEQRLHEWRQAMARLGLHVTVEFDTVAPALDGETQLYDKLALLVESRSELLHRLRQNITEQRKQRRRDAIMLIAEMAIDIAAWRNTTPSDPDAITAATRFLRSTVRQREHLCVQALLKRYNFDSATFPAHQLPLQGERWKMDLFHPEALKDMGIHVTKGVAAGAMAGATIDALAAGVTLGAGTLIGAAAGGLWQGADKWGKRLYSRLKGFQELSVDENVVRLLIVRQLALLDALDRRGHAAQDPITLTTDEGMVPNADIDYRQAPLPDAIISARAHPQWSALADGYAPSRGRNQAIRNLAEALGAPTGTNTPEHPEPIYPELSEPSSGPPSSDTTS